jgi:hypothetical protein
MVHDMPEDDQNDAPRTPPRRQPRAPTSRASRSAVANGKRLISGVDTHSREYREYRDVVLDLVYHLGSDATAVQRAICEEAGALIVWCRAERVKLLQGDPDGGGKSPRWPMRERVVTHPLPPFHPTLSTMRLSHEAQVHLH